MGNARFFVEYLSQYAQQRCVCGPVVLRTWPCSETTLVCLNIRDLLGFVLLGMVFGWACHARTEADVMLERAVALASGRTLGRLLLPVA